jgi:HYR domain
MKKMKNYCYCYTATLLLLLSGPLKSQVTFQKNYGSNADEVATWVANTATGYIVAGTTTNNNNQDGFLLNLDFSGQVIWQKQFGGSGTDRLNAVYQAPDGFIVLGETNTYGAGGFDAWILKVSNTGNLIWSRTLGDADRDEGGLGLVQVSGNRILVSGSTTPIGTTGFNSYFHLLNNMGQSIWSKRVESGSTGNLLRSNYVDNGVIYASGGAEQDGAYLQLNLETGDFIGGRSYIGSSTEALYYQQPTVDGNLLLCDHTWSAFGGAQMAMWVQKVTPIGQTIWSRVYRIPNQNLRGRIEDVGDDNYLLTPHNSTLNAGSDAMLVKINDLGMIQWARNYGRPGRDWLYKSQLAADGGYISVGAITNAAGNLDVLVIKTDDLGLVDGCCIKNVNILAQGYTHSNLAFTFTNSTWAQAASTATQQNTPNFQVLDYCASIPVDTSFEFQLCPNQPFTYNGIDYFAPNTISDTLTGQSGCDSIVHYNLRLLPKFEVFFDIALCPNEPFTFNGVDYFAPGLVSDTSTTLLGCDSINHYGLLLLPHSEDTVNISLCPDEPFTLHGANYFAPGTVSDTLANEFGCDSIVHYNLLLLPKVEVFNDIGLCPGEPFTFNGVDYFAPGLVSDTLSSIAGCDSIIYYGLLLLPHSEQTLSVSLCPNEPFSFNGTNYFAPGIVSDTLANEFGCDSIIHYNLLLLPQPTRAVSIKLCPGETVVIAGQTYTQPATVVVTVPAAIGCDTLVTYTLSSQLPAPSVVSVQCPGDISVIVDPGMAPTVVNYSLPTASSNCPCPGLSLNLTSGLASGELFPNGITQVCYNAVDACGNNKTCCFKVTVREFQPCDVKVIGCMRYELLTITADAIQQKTYRIKVTNSCPNKMIYSAFQLPNGVTAVSPANLSVFTADSDRKYEVRNPNFTPFYSIRFKSIADSIANGQSDIFEYTLPPQSAPNYIHVTTRLATQLFFESHLNTFYCPIGITPTGNRNEEEAVEMTGQELALFPNPNDGALWVDLGKWNGKGLQYRIFNTQGQRILESNAFADDALLRIELPSGMPNGLYFFELSGENGQKETLRFVLQR